MSKSQTLKEHLLQEGLAPFNAATHRACMECAAEAACTGSDVYIHYILYIYIVKVKSNYIYSLI